MSEALRRVVFFACAAFIIVAPGYKQLVARAPSYAVRWDMFGHKSQDLYEVRFESQDETGKRVPLDRFALLGFSDPRKAPRSVRTFKQEHEAWSTARALCRALGPDKPVFMTLRDATRDGWKMIDDGTRDVCTRRAPSGHVSPESNDEDDVP